jgi:hypothetical protein
VFIFRTAQNPTPVDLQLCHTAFTPSAYFPKFRYPRTAPLENILFGFA